MSTDPLGRRALFSPPPEATDPLRRGSARKSEGKEALYSTPSTSPGFTTVLVDCSACGARARIGVLELCWRHLPFWLWLPWARYSNLMTCPACERRTWLGISFFA
ncbi:MAG: hypothetical protein ACRDYV_00260 [Acidimicrobiia bacterium]